MNEDDSEFECYDDEIVEMVLKNGRQSNESDSEDTDAEIETVPYAIEAFGTALQFVEQQENSTTPDYAVIKKWCDLATLKRTSTACKQLLTSYFARDQ